MSRLTDHDYLANRPHLQAVRENEKSAFVRLRVNEQWDLFAYYLPHGKHADADIVAHRHSISVLDPSLPQRAGRALSKLRRIEAALPAYREYLASGSKRRKGAKYEIRTYGALHPTLDPARFAQILMQAAQKAATAESARTSLRVAEGDTSPQQDVADGSGADTESLADGGERAA